MEGRGEREFRPEFLDSRYDDKRGMFQRLLEGKSLSYVIDSNHNLYAGSYYYHVQLEKAFGISEDSIIGGGHFKLNKTGSEIVAEKAFYLPDLGGSDSEELVKNKLNEDLMEEFEQFKKTFTQD